MPIDMRLLRFTLNEVTKVLRDFGPRLGIKIPQGRVVSCFGEADKGSLVRFSFAIKGVAGEKTFMLPKNDLIACLIFFCQSRKIPLPRTGGKTVVLKSDCVELRVVIKSLANV